jgi:hypothetical protein
VDLHVAPDDGARNANRGRAQVEDAVGLDPSATVGGDIERPDAQSDGAVTSRTTTEAGAFHPSSASSNPMATSLISGKRATSRTWRPHSTVRLTT